MKHFPYRPVGAWPDGHGCYFRCWAPRVRQLELVLQGADERRIPLQQDEWGYWETHISSLAAGQLYGYAIDGDARVYPDPASRYQANGVHGPSTLVELPSYRHSARWAGRPLREMMIYEVHVGTFTEEGTFDALIRRLDDLVELGINALEIMPLAQCPGARNWGYDGVHPFAVNAAYGGPQGFARLVEACHDRNVAVLLDVVYNHLGPEGNYLVFFGPYTTDKHHTPWGESINMDDAHADGVRNYFIQNALYWLRAFGVDGFRLDAVHAIKDSSAEHFLQELKRQVDALSEETGRTYVLLGECDLNAPRYLEPLERGGYGLDGQWSDEFHHALHALLTGERKGYYEDFGSVEHVEQALSHGYVYTGQYSVHRQRNFGRFAAGAHTGQFVVFLQNHDQVGNRAQGDRLIHTLTEEQYLLAAGTYLLSPFVPLIFMGEEYGEERPFQYFVSHTDPSVVEAVRHGRTAEFAAFIGAAQGVPDPQAETTFRNSQLSHRRNDRVYEFYRACLRLRRQLLSAATFDFEQIRATSNAEGIVSWNFPLTDALPPHRMWANFSKEDRRLDLGQEATVAIASQAVSLADGQLQLPAYSFVALALSSGKN